MARVTDTQTLGLILTLLQSGANMTAVARKAGVTLKAIQQRIKRNPDVVYEHYSYHAPAFLRSVNDCKIKGMTPLATATTLNASVLIITTLYKGIEIEEQFKEKRKNVNP